MFCRKACATARISWVNYQYKMLTYVFVKSASKNRHYKQRNNFALYITFLQLVYKNNHFTIWYFKICTHTLPYCLANIECSLPAVSLVVIIHHSISHFVITFIFLLHVQRLLCIIAFVINDNLRALNEEFFDAEHDSQSAKRLQRYCWQQRQHKNSICLAKYRVLTYDDNHRKRLPKTNFTRPASNMPLLPFPEINMNEADCLTNDQSAY